MLLSDYVVVNPTLTFPASSTSRIQIASILDYIYIYINKRISRFLLYILAKVHVHCETTFKRLWSNCSKAMLDSLLGPSANRNLRLIPNSKTKCFLFAIFIIKRLCFWWPAIVIKTRKHLSTEHQGEKSTGWCVTASSESHVREQCIADMQTLVRTFTSTSSARRCPLKYGVLQWYQQHTCCACKE